MQIGVETATAVESKRVFVIDDDGVFRAAIQFMLHDEYEAHEVESISSALAKARDARPDLLIVAESVVRASGIGLLAKLLAQIPKARILAIVESNGYGEECIAAGAHGFLVKPLRVELVRAKADALLRSGGRVFIPLAVLNVR